MVVRFESSAFEVLRCSSNLAAYKRKSYFLTPAKPKVLIRVDRHKPEGLVRIPAQGATLGDG